MTALTTPQPSLRIFHRDPLPDPDECLACFWLRQISAGREHEVLCIDHLREHVEQQQSRGQQLRIWIAEHRSPLEQAGIVAICVVLLAGAWLVPLGLLPGLPR